MLFRWSSDFYFERKRTGHCRLILSPVCLCAHRISASDVIYAPDMFVTSTLSVLTNIVTPAELFRDSHGSGSGVPCYPLAQIQGAIVSWWSLPISPRLRPAHMKFSRQVWRKFGDRTALTRRREFGDRTELTPIPAEHLLLLVGRAGLTSRVPRRQRQPRGSA